MGAYLAGCWQKQQSEVFVSRKLLKRNQRIAQDYNQFKQDKWFRFQQKILFDPNKFIFLYPNYSEEQQILKRKWKEVQVRNINYIKQPLINQCLSEKWKFAIRKGVPITHYKSIINFISNKNIEIDNITKQYHQISDEILNNGEFKKQIRKGSLFGRDGKLNQYAHIQFLNSQGLTALSNILWILQKTIGSPIYNRYICHVAGLFLIFIQEQQAYDILVSLLQSSINLQNSRLQSLRWHFSVTYTQLERFADNFFEVAQKQSGSILCFVNQCKKYRLSLADILREVIQSFFYGYLSFPIILKIFLLFFNEGVRIFYRIFYGMLIICSESLKDLMTNNKILQAMRNKCIMLNNQQANNLFKIGYSINFKHQSPTILDSEDQNQDVVRIFLPEVKGQSQILSLDQLPIIWSYLPYNLKSNDIYRIIQEPQQMNLNTFISELSGVNSIIVIETLEKSIFGVFLDGGLKPIDTKQYYGSSRNFVFQLEPIHRKYAATGQNIFYINSFDKMLSIGGDRQGPALQINFSLTGGSSFKSATYNNQPLHSSISGEFSILKIQAFRFC